MRTTNTKDDRNRLLHDYFSRQAEECVRLCQADRQSAGSESNAQSAFRRSAVEGHERSKSEIGVEIARHARELGERHPEWWLNDRVRGIYKCNVFLDRVGRISGARLPWKPGEIPRVRDMIPQLQKDSQHWEQVWPDGKHDIDRFAKKAGDFAMWNKTMTMLKPSGHGVEHDHIEHCGVLDSKGELLYAGSPSSEGYTQTPLRYFTHGVLGAPTAVFRYKGKIDYSH